MQGFYCKISHNDVAWAKLWAMFLCLQQAKQLGIAEMDSEALVDMLLKGFSPNPALNFLVRDIVDLARRRD